MTRKWVQSDHLCRACFGRIYRSDDHQRVWRCSNCGLESSEKSVRSICCCGAKYRNGDDRKLRCQRNERHVQGISGEVVVVSVDGGE